MCPSATQKAKVLIYVHFGRPGVAGAVIQTALSFAEWAFSSNIFNHLHSETFRAKKLNFWEDVPHTPSRRRLQEALRQQKKTFFFMF